ncbi:MAG: SNF2 family DNA or RNA helicase [Verrucomicrobiales bacterium]|jgi:SNF2 family DNA or RNA helicase
MSIVNTDYAHNLQQSGWPWEVEAKVAKNGAKLQQLGAVKGLKSSTVANGQVRMTANVRHPNEKATRGVLIFLSRQPGGQVMVTPNCSCPSDHMCDHVIAVMHEFIFKSHHPSGGGSQKSRPAAKRSKHQLGPKTVRYLACLIVPTESGALALEVLHSPRAVIDGPGFTRCSGRELYRPDLAEELGQRWMRMLLMRLQQCCPDSVTDSDVLQIQPDSETWTELLDELLKWQILYWGGGPNPIMLHHGEPRRAEPTWRFDGDREGFVTDWELTEPAQAIIPSAPLHFIDTRRRIFGSLKTPFPNTLAVSWIANDRQPSAQLVRAWNAEVKQAGNAARFPLPPTQEVIDAREIKPKLCLHLSHRELPRSTMRGIWSPIFQGQSVASLIFRYGENDVPERGKGIALEDERIRILRNETAERTATDLLNQLGLLPFSNTLPPDIVTEEFVNLRWIGSWEETASQAGWMAFMTEQVPKLEDNGWQIHYADDFGMRFVQPERWIQELREQRNRSWFEFELGVECDGERIDLIPILIAYLQDHADIERQIEFLDGDDKVPIKLDDGRYLAFPVKRLEPIVRILRDILEDRRAKHRDDDLREVHQIVAAEFLNEAADFTDAGTASTSLQAISNRLGDFKGIDKKSPPQGLQATLRPYQEEGFRWLQFLTQYGLGGILADDMGLGKTLQTIAHLLAEKEKGSLNKPALIVAPTSLLGNWQDEIGKFAPSLTVHLHYGSGRHRQRQPFDAADIIITSYSLVYRDQEYLETRCFSHLILDEAQNIKNPGSRSAQAACALDAEHRLCVSGTPIENHLEELWSLFHFLMPGFLGRQESFRQRFRHPIEKENDENARDLLASRVGPLMLRRKKTEVATELPPKTEMIRSVELEGPQRDLYETIRASMQQRVQEVIAEQGMDRAHLYILDALLKLRQVCCHPHLLDLEAAQSVETSAKMELLFELLPEMIAEGRRILLFSQFTSMLGLIEKRLLREDIGYVKLTGNTRNRSDIVREFQTGKVPLFLISLKAGGVGLNLTKADTVIHYDPWWNPAVESQATDRAYRIGQDNPVFVYKLITKGSIEERIVAMQEDKKELVESLLSAGTKRGMKFGKADLEQLLKPLS